MNLFFLVGYDLDRSPWATRPRAILKEILAKGQFSHSGGFGGAS